MTGKIISLDQKSALALFSLQSTCCDCNVDLRQVADGSDERNEQIFIRWVTKLVLFGVSTAFEEKNFQDMFLGQLIFCPSRNAARMTDIYSLVLLRLAA